MFSVKNIWVASGHHLLLKNFSCDFTCGQLSMIIGPNGAGKTTLLKCLDGERTPSEGEITFHQIPLANWNKKEIARKRAVLPQYSNLDFPFTVKDVVLIGRSPHDTNDTENLKIANQALEHCGCEHLADRPFPTLSGGEQQRVHIARVLAQIWNNDNEPGRFLLLDEPVSALDLNHQYALLRLLKQLAIDHQLGIICTLHNLNLAAQFAHRCLIINHGEHIADGPPSSVLTETTLSAVFSLEMWVKPHPQNKEIPLIMPKL